MPPTSEVMAEGLPWLSPIRNSSELRGLCYRSYFGPRMCGRSITIFHRSVRGSQSGFPLLTPTMETYDGPAWRLMSTFCVQPKAPRCSRPCPISGVCETLRNTSF